MPPFLLPALLPQMMGLCWRTLTFHICVMCWHAMGSAFLGRQIKHSLWFQTFFGMAGQAWGQDPLPLQGTAWDSLFLRKTNSPISISGVALSSQHIQELLHLDHWLSCLCLSSFPYNYFRPWCVTRTCALSLPPTSLIPAHCLSPFLGGQWDTTTTSLPLTVAIGSIYMDCHLLMERRAIQAKSWEGGLFGHVSFYFEREKN